MRILVVDDERRLAAGLRNGLEAEGFTVDVALTGTDGLWLAREHPYDAIARVMGPLTRARGWPAG